MSVVKAKSWADRGGGFSGMRLKSLLHSAELAKYTNIYLIVPPIWVIEMK